MKFKQKETLEETVKRLRKESATMKLAIMFLASVMVMKDLMTLLMYYFK